jgi:hypothetical protein
MIKPVALLLFIGLGFSQSRDYPNFEVIINNNPYSKPIFLHSMSGANRYMAIIDSNLNVIWNINSGSLGLDFKVNQNNLTYFDKDEESWRILNEYMIETDTLRCEGGYNADYHDIQIMNDGSYLLQAYDSIFVDMSTIVSNGSTNALIHLLIIQEFDLNHNLIFEWNAWDHLNIADYTNLNLTANNITWMHGNSIDIDVDEHLLISNRRSSEIIKINRFNGEVIWHLGGPLNEFSFINDPYNGFRKQHDVRRMANGHISVFDNGNTHEPPISRVLEYSIDEDEKIVDLIWEYIHPDSIVSVAMGSAQRLPNDNTLINWGTISNQGAIITEVDYDKNIVLEIHYPLDFHSYKVRKSDWQFSTNLLAGDTNLDNIIDIIDINYIVNYSIDSNIEPDIFHLFRFDINNDRIIDTFDIELLVEHILFNRFIII